MLPPEQEALLSDILIYAKKARAFCRGITEESFNANEEKQFAVIRCLEIIGEAVARLSPDGQKALPDQQMRGMRNRLVHDYRNVSLRIVWEAVSNDLGPLVQTLEARLPGGN